MGCGASSKLPVDNTHKDTKAIKAALLIQAWYRRYLARLEAKRNYSWSIFQKLEYSSEQDQLKLYNFFNDMMLQLELAASCGENESRRNVITAMSLLKRKTQDTQNPEEMDNELMEMTNPDLVGIPDTYTGLHITFPLTSKQLEKMTAAFKNDERLHAKYVLQILHEIRQALMVLPNIQKLSVKGKVNQLTVIGDLHGKLDDLLTIFYKNGPPSGNNPYLFNGDFVDRGANSVEITMLIFSYALVHPGSVFFNRGNHEDHVMNLRYGFVKELVKKYKKHSPKVLNLYEDVFSWLPLVSVVDNHTMITHGGISDRTDLTAIAQINRHSYLSLLRPPKDAAGDTVNAMEWRQLLDLLWSDPRARPGCAPNDFRGGGVYWGPDITHKILSKHGFQMLIRSHECKQEGYEYSHNDKVLTIFSASNYYEVGSNKGAYVRIASDLKQRIIQFISSKSTARSLSMSNQLNVVEASALRSLREKIVANTTELLKQFKHYDPRNAGAITLNQWSCCMSTVLSMDLPWHKLSSKLVRSNNVGMIIYKTTFECHVENKLKAKASGDLTETLYKNKDSLETIFRAIDTDNSGTISVTEFEEACSLLSQHTHSSLTREDIETMAKNIDQNNDGLIDFNEFLEAFRIVDQFGEDYRRRSELEMDDASSQATVNPAV